MPQKFGWIILLTMTVFTTAYLLLSKEGNPASEGAGSLALAQHKPEKAEEDSSQKPPSMESNGNPFASIPLALDSNNQQAGEKGENNENSKAGTITSLAKNCQVSREQEEDFSQWLFELQAVAAEFLSAGLGTTEEKVAAAIYVTDSRSRDRLTTFQQLMEQDPSNPDLAERVLRECAVLGNVCDEDFFAEVAANSQESVLSRLTRARYYIRNNNPDLAIDNLMLATTAPELGEFVNQDLAAIAEFSDQNAINLPLGQGQMQLWQALMQDSARYYMSSVSDLSNLCINTQSGVLQTTCAELGDRLSEDSNNLLGRMLGSILQTMGDPELVNATGGETSVTLGAYGDELEDFGYKANALERLAANDTSVMNRWWQAQLRGGDFVALDAGINHALELAQDENYQPCD